MRSQKGFSLIENLVAMTVLGIIGLTLLSGLALAARSNIIANEITTAEALAKSQMDYVQSLPYDRFGNPPSYARISGHTDYDIDISAVRLDPNNVGDGADYGVQQITVTVSRAGKTITTLTDYKVNR